MKKIDFLKSIGAGIVSVDFCRGRTLRQVGILRHVDVAFISDEDIFMNLEEMSMLTKLGVLMHHKGGSMFYSKGKKLFENKVEIIGNVNVLGCGDRFASYFIQDYLKNEKIETAIINSHNYVTKILKRKKQ